jgi:RNA polymerase subunit RPABC4/transcription elongation factor Spt4
MASYKHSCMHCGALLDRDASFCPMCGNSSPFGYVCPTCLHPIEKGQQLCQSCGRPLYVVCPLCGGRTFVAEKCEACGGSLMIRCPNERCDMPQFFENERCSACGKKIKEKYRRPGG